MNRVLRICIASCTLAAALLGSGCVVHEAYAPPPPGPVAYYNYYYYPDCEVYYYPVTGVYWWIDGSVWVSGPHPPPRFILRDDVRVTVQLHSNRPWTEHHEVIRRYPRHEQRREERREER